MKYRGRTSAVITINLVGKLAAEARVTFTAKQASLNAERIIARKELVFENGNRQGPYIDVFAKPRCSFNLHDYLISSVF